jgi:predicted esterase YcpF (UPF0227 family)
MNILYLHGLDSKLSPEKREILKKYGTVYAPDLNYYEDENAIQTILNYYPNVQLDIVMGSSMGGFAGYHVADKLDLPALLFNPAVAERSVKQQIPAEEPQQNSLKHIVLGQVDDVVDPKDTLNFLMEHFNSKTHLHLHLVPQLGHNIPVPFFEKEVASFFQKL